jgi:hypothetical protein
MKKIAIAVVLLFFVSLSSAASGVTLVSQEIKQTSSDLFEWKVVLENVKDMDISVRVTLYNSDGQEAGLDAAFAKPMNNRVTLTGKGFMKNGLKPTNAVIEVRDSSTYRTVMSKRVQMK